MATGDRNESYRKTGALDESISSRLFDITNLLELGFEERQLSAGFVELKSLGFGENPQYEDLMSMTRCNLSPVTHRHELDLR